ncbi:hypothetical protein CEXT_285481 [Caerostris extrusa]|uniref:Uncharacterized protein n=1 Tax=Caerostris extrusa TaxID=172846 RepID=A0AAV4T378_CAEEX|nr:hypothetical protein CEXT_285481 [Caerostris extrusa]
MAQSITSSLPPRGIGHLSKHAHRHVTCQDPGLFRTCGGHHGPDSLKCPHLWLPTISFSQNFNGRQFKGTRRKKKNPTYADWCHRIQDMWESKKEKDFFLKGGARFLSTDGRWSWSAY